MLHINTNEIHVIPDNTKRQTQPHALWEKLKIHVLLVCFVLFSTPYAFFNVENIRRTNRLLIIKHIISEHNINR